MVNEREKLKLGSVDPRERYKKNRLQKWDFQTDYDDNPGVQYDIDEYQMLGANERTYYDRIKELQTEADASAVIAREAIATGHYKDYEEFKHKAKQLLQTVDAMEERLLKWNQIKTTKYLPSTDGGVRYKKEIKSTIKLPDPSPPMSDAQKDRLSKTNYAHISKDVEWESVKASTNAMLESTVSVKSAVDQLLSYNKSFFDSFQNNQKMMFESFQRELAQSSADSTRLIVEALREARVNLDVPKDVKSKAQKKKDKQKTTQPSEPKHESKSKCSKDCKGERTVVKFLYTPDGLKNEYRTLECDCKKKAGNEARMPGNHPIMLGQNDKCSHFLDKLKPVFNGRGEQLGHAVVYRNKSGHLYVLFNNHFIVDHSGVHIKIGENVINLSAEASEQYKHMDLRRQRLPSNIQCKTVNLGVYDLIYNGSVTVVSNLDNIPRVAVGTTLSVGNDTSNSGVHINSNYHSMPGWCGSVATIDCANVVGIHYHTDGENSANQFIPFVKEVFDFLTSQDL